MSDQLDEQSITSWLAKRSGWAVKDGSLVKEWRFKSFRDSIVFVNRIASLADESSHPPEIHIRGGNIRLALMTPQSGGITKRDLEFAQAIDFATSAR